jgi:hypothetical protein
MHDNCYYSHGNSGIFRSLCPSLAQARTDTRKNRKKLIKNRKKSKKIRKKRSKPLKNMKKTFTNSTFAHFHAPSQPLHLAYFTKNLPLFLPRHAHLYRKFCPRTAKIQKFPLPNPSPIAIIFSMTTENTFSSPIAKAILSLSLILRRKAL